ncbi:chymotrypsin family serine protease [Pyrococcus kukulkanii]|uniref:Uncharacterized protein n=1 Tax=Pyrococcus kukulkanii TaxID=1609559 RepID=A0A127BC75_9EURY|nr:hypothetical protein [Pyrococcus kukulkanii]AMM54805.1 hypothetical protein TQ32_10120 [Pyrococcus kukulkanii]
MPMKYTITLGMAEVTPEKLKLLENELEKLGIPKEVIRVEKRRISLGNPIQSASISLESSTSITLMGGMPIIGTNIEGEHGIGALGYVGYLNKYFVTAGHPGSWGYSGQEVYDSNWIEIGIITRNPPFKYSSGFCYYRYSDAALVKVTNPNANIVPKIYMDYTVIGKRPSNYQIVGETVHRVGAVGGDVVGTITRKYVTVFFNPSEPYYPDEVKFLGQIEAVFNGGEKGIAVLRYLRFIMLPMV